MNKKTLFISLGLALCVLLVLGFLFYTRKKTAQAPLPLNPSTIEEIQARGVEQYRAQVYAPVIEVYRRMLEKMPENADLKKKLAFAYFSAARYDEAKPLLEAAAGSPAADAEAFYELAFIAKREGKNDAAAAFLKRSLELDPNHKDAKDLQGKLSSK